MVGAWVDKYPDSVKDIAKRGHDVGNHSDTHAHLPQLTDEGIKKSLLTVTKRLKAYRKKPCVVQTAVR